MTKRDTLGLFAYHPATRIGSLLAGPAQPRVASRDAEPLLERPGLSERLVRRLPAKRLGHPAPSAS